MVVDDVSRRQERRRFLWELRARGAGVREIACVFAARYRVGPMIALRWACDLSQAEVAERCHELRDDPEARMTGGRISQWERWPGPGSRRPPVDALVLLARVYDCGVGDLVDTGMPGARTRSEGTSDVGMPLLHDPGLVARPDALVPAFQGGDSLRRRCVCLPAGAGVKEECPVHRRDFLAAAGVTALEAAGAISGLDVLRRSSAFRELGLAGGASPGRIGLAQAERIASAVPHLHALDDEFGGDAPAQLTLRYLHQVHRWLREANYAEPVGRRLHAVAGALTEHVAWMRFDAGRHAEAQQLYDRALTEARLSTDASVEVLVLAGMSLQALHLGQGRAALDLIGAAKASPATARSPQLGSLLALRQARAGAVLGDTSGSSRVLNEACRLLDRASAGERPVWTAFHGSAELLAGESGCHSSLGDSIRARRLLEDALDAQDLSYVRNRANYTARLAVATADDGDLDQAAEIATQVIVMTEYVDSFRVVEYLWKLRARTADHDGVQVIRAFNEQFDAVLAARGRP